MQGMPQVHPRLIKRKEKHLTHPLGDASHYDHEEESVPDPDNQKTSESSTQASNKTASKERTANHNIKGGGKAVRFCILLPNGTVMWREPDTSMCREEKMQEAEKAAKAVLSLTKSPSAVNSSTFTEAADKLAEIVKHAVKDQDVSGLYRWQFSGVRG